MTLGIVLLQGARRGVFRMIEEPLYISILAGLGRARFVQLPTWKLVVRCEMVVVMVVVRAGGRGCSTHLTRLSGTEREICEMVIVMVGMCAGGSDTGI